MSSSKTRNKMMKRLSASVSELLSSTKRSSSSAADDEEPESSLHHATLMGNVHLLRMLINNAYCSVDVQDAKGIAPLHCAVANPSSEMASLLLKNGATVDIVDKEGNTPLHLASKQGLIDTVNVLLYYKADVTIRNDELKTAFDLACEFGRLKVVDQFLSSESASFFLSHSSSSKYQCERISGLNDTLSSRSGRKICIETTGLHLATKNGHLEVIALLIESGFDLNRRTYAGSALHEAAHFCQLDAARLLLFVRLSVLLVSLGIDSSLHNCQGQKASDILKRYSGKQLNVAKEIKKLIKESERSTYAEAVTEYFGKGEELSFTTGAVIWVLDQSSSEKDHCRWKGAIFGPKYNSRIGYFPQSAVKLIDKHTTMQRSITQRSAKKVNLPIVPPINNNCNLSNNDQQDGIPINSSSPAQFNCPKSSNGSCSTFKGANGGSWSVMSTPLMSRNPAAALIRPHNHQDGSETPVQHRNGQRRVMKLTTVTSTTSTNLNSPRNMDASGTMNQTLTASDSAAARHQVSAGHNNILNAVTSPRHRNSTGSNYSTSSSSGIESIQGIHQIRRSGVGIDSSGESGTGGVGSGGGASGVVCRQSVHSNSSSSGSLSSSLERLDESGYASQVNISEMINSGLPEPEVLGAWLHDLHFADYTALFLNGGYDLTTVSRMTPEDLTAIGITKPGHRKRLTMEIHRLSIQDNWPDREPPGGLNEWLTILRLSEYIELFNEEGYNSLDQVLELTWEDFEDFGIHKLGHLKKLELAIKKVKDTRSGRMKGNGRNMHEVPSPYQRMTNNNSSPSPIHQSRSLAEVRTFPMMNGGGGGGGQQLAISSSSSEYSQPYQNHHHYITNPSTPMTPRSTPRPPAQSNHMSSFMMNGTMSSTNSNGHQFDTFPRRRSSHQSNSNIQMIPEGGEQQHQHQVVTHHVTHAIIHSPSAANNCYAVPNGHHHVVESNNDSPNSTSPSSSSSTSSGAYSYGNIGVSNNNGAGGGDQFDASGGGEPIYGNYDIHSDRRIELNLVTSPRHSQKHKSKTGVAPQPAPPRPPKRQQDHHNQYDHLQNQNPPPKPPMTNNHQSTTTNSSLLLSGISKPHHHDDNIEHHQNQQQLNNQTSSDSIFNTTMSPAPSFDCLPPPVIRCEESIKNLRSMIAKKQHQKSTNQDQQQIYANISGSSTPAKNDTHNGADESSSGNCVVPPSTSSVAATSTCSSTETLPFANDNCGTIKLTKNGAASTASSNSNESTTLSQHSPVLTPIDNNEMDPTDKNSVPSSRISSNKSSKTHGPDVLNDIGDMLQNLTDELDALLVPATGATTAAASGPTEEATQA